MRDMYIYPNSILDFGKK